MIGRKKLVRESERDQKCEEKLCAFSDRNKRLRNGTERGVTKGGGTRPGGGHIKPMNS